ncbi:TetR/AcrR family transcriptional regulator [Actinocatenispora rupis]|uniref:TetR family transcriptional regulator n=1 Tax=Actinocatenispora rupis TaxID=519421 RepID=A0A8J3NAT1_9ACTN|nr:TetR/AcrR family transcriptional regulator [Actinocatenispora rupis]GID10025.1 TetR family transcriptional regulator [Actinocatenispora rupis]
MAKHAGSRRERPAKPALSREWIIAATIEIVRTEGLEKATMRRVAQALDTGPASLYVYVANTAELRAAVLDELIGQLPLGRGRSGWLARIESALSAYREVLVTYPGLARSALVLRPTGPNVLRLYDRILGLLIEGDVPADRAAWGADLLVQQVTASAAEHGAAAPGDVDTPADPETALTRAVRDADPETAPHVHAHADTVLAGPPEARASWAIRALVAGIAATPVPRSGH